MNSTPEEPRDDPPSDPVPPLGDVPPPPPPPGAIPPAPGYGPPAAGYGPPAAGYGPPPGYGPSAGYGPPRPPFRAGSSIGLGVGIGCGLQVLATVLLFATLALTNNFFGALWAFILVTVAAVVLMFFPLWRRFATGVLIVSAATWLVAIGPCIALINGFP